MFGRIIGTGSYIPEKIIKNDDLKNFIDTSDEWITERTGIKRRHIVQNETASDMAFVAGKRAIESAGINQEDIDLIIVSTVSSDTLLPSTACRVQEMLGAENAMSFDLNAACTGFITAYNTAQSYINTDLIETALIIGTEVLSKIVDWTDRGTAILFGDGAGAVVIRKSPDAKFETIMQSDGQKGNALVCNNPMSKRIHPVFSSNYEKNGNENDTYIAMNGQEVFRFAVRKVPESITGLMNRMGKTEQDIDYFLLHQANKRIIESVAKRLKTSMDKVPTNVAEYGNTSSASIPILLDEMVKNKKIKRNDKIIMSGFGAGLTWSSVYLEL